MDEDHTVLHIHLDFSGKATLFDERLGYPNSTRVTDGYQGRFHVSNVATLWLRVNIHLVVCRFHFAGLGQRKSVMGGRWTR